MARNLHSGVSEQAKASKHRLDDAHALFAVARWRGAMYLAGYSVECLLKAKLMRMYDCRHLDELDEELRRRGVLSDDATVFTHRLEPLLALTGARDRLRASRELLGEFSIVNQWMPAWRYSSDLSSRED